MPRKKSAKKQVKAPAPSVKTQKLNPKALGLAIGFTTAIFIFFLALIASSKSGWGYTLLLEIKSLYIGYDKGILGGIAGALWGFIDGFIMGYLIAFFYNKFS